MAKDSGTLSLVERYRPSLFVLASQVAAATLNAAAKYAETRLEQVHPFQVLHVRMLITALGCTWYLWRIGGTSKSDMLFGTPDVRGLILLRALGGTCGASGFFFSMVYLSLSEATALNFLGPLGSLILTRYLSFATVQWTDCLGAVGALGGVVLIAQPEEIFGAINAAERDVSGDATNNMKGLAFAVLGLCGGVITLTSIRCIGTRAHPLTSVNVFAWSLAIVSWIGLMIVPGITWPKNPLVWACLIYIGTCGLAMEFLLTVGISSDTSSAATLMIYSQIVWALILDRVLFQTTINLWAILGAVTVIGSLTLVTLSGNGQKLDSTAYTDIRCEDPEAGRLSLDEVHAEQTNP
ncbi:hypothetical protein F4781DRAFT_307347 [Annulohypoxylon bovei var. microspora]|nr:hypothetical protein F4781DRAFT_307347 [Annulohypoxylon bovei var. microspora]